MKILVLSLITIGLVTVADQTVLDGRVSSLLNAPTVQPLAFLSRPALNLGDTLHRLSGFWRLAKENQKLESESYSLLARLAEMENLRTENSRLHQALDLPVSVRGRLVQAGLYQSSFTPLGYSLQVNRGYEDNVEVGDPVITAEGILVGQVVEVSRSSARLRPITDPSFEATVRTLGSNVSAIAQGTPGGQMVLDFVSHVDQVKSGDTVVTDGNDRFPASLIIGKVELIREGGADVFKEVRVEPALIEGRASPIFIIVGSN